MQLHQIVLIMLMAAIVAAAPLHWKEKSESRYVLPQCCLQKNLVLCSQFCLEHWAILY